MGLENMERKARVQEMEEVSAKRIITLIRK